MCALTILLHFLFFYAAAHLDRVLPWWVNKPAHFRGGEVVGLRAQVMKITGPPQCVGRKGPGIL